MTPRHRSRIPPLLTPSMALTWSSLIAHLDQRSSLLPGLQAPPFTSSLFSPQQPKYTCGHLSQVTSLLRLDPSVAPTFFRVKAKGLPEDHRPCTIYLLHLPFHLFPLLTPSSHNSLLAVPRLFIN